MPSGSTTFHVRFVYGDSRQDQEETLRELQGKTGGLVLIPLTGECEGRTTHRNTALVSPNVIMHADPSTWKRRQCDHCRSKVLMKPDYERMYGKKT